MKTASLACILAALMLAACSRDSNPPEKPSPAMPPRPTVETAAPTLFATPGALPAAERHFELFQQIHADRALLIEVRLSQASS